MRGILGGLNASQAQAVTATDKHMLLVAGPGTGKTLTIVRRVAHLLEQGVPPEQICALTFTNRAAREMRERIEALLGAGAKGMFVGTFHLLGLNIVRKGVPESLTVCGREEQIKILKPMVGNSARAAREMAEEITRVKSCAGGRVQDAGSRRLQDELQGEPRRLYEAYQAALKEKGLCDFDDLICVPIELLETEPVVQHWCNRFSHIIVDEYQDINPAQYRLLSSLVRVSNASLCAVGDADQAIYAFRGADVENFLNFRKDFAGAAHIALTENYRSTEAVLAAADAMIRHNQRRLHRDVVALRGPGRPVTVLSVPDERAEAEAIVQEIEARMGGTSHYRLAGAGTSHDFSEATYSFSDFGVLFRTNAQARALKEAFDEWGIPCQVVGERHPLNNKVLVDTLREQIDRLPDHLDLAAFLKGAASEAGAQAADASLLESIGAAYRHLPTREALIEIINELALLTSADVFDPRADAVALMTLHMAKGLEFKMVFITGCEEGLVPFTLINDCTDIEEERRLFYVGMTRARDDLVLLHARTRFMYGRSRAPNPSPFLAEIPAQFTRTEFVQEKKKAKKGKQASLF